MRLPGFRVLMVLIQHIAYPVSIQAATRTQAVKDGRLELGAPSSELNLITGDWRFASQNVAQILDEDMERLPLRNPFQSYFQFLNLASGPKQGAYILQIHSEQSIVRRILVTMLDISLEYEAERELDEKNKDLSIIRELVDTGPKKCMQFFSTARQLLEENRRLLDKDFTFISMRPSA